MAVVSIDYDKCIACSACIEASPKCFSRIDEKVAPLVDENTCMLCGRCVAVCPTDAITHHAMDMANFPQTSQRGLVDTDNFLQFIRERRSHRAFTNRKVLREDLEKLIDAVRYAPTGHNDQTVEIVILTNPDKRKRLSNLTVDFIASLAERHAKKLADLKATGKGAPEELAEIRTMVEFFQTLVQDRDRGFDPIFYEAPAVAIFHSTMKCVTPKDNCVIAAATMGLLARTMGLETTYIALFEHAFKAHKPVRDELDLPEGHQVLSALVIGYPKVKFLRAVDRKKINTRWE